MREFELRPIPVADTRRLRQAVLRPNMTLDQLAAHEAPAAYGVGIYEDAELISVGFVAPDGNELGSWRVRGMATAPDRRRLGAGAAVLDALLQHALARGATRVWCNARVSARSLYERAGFRTISAEFELPEIGPHYVMEKLFSQ